MPTPRPWEARTRLLSVAVVSLCGALVPAPAPAQDEAVDTVSIALARTEALVRHRIPNLGDRVVALALRVPGQRLDVTGVIREGEALLDATLVEEEGAYRFEVESGAPIVVSYRVTGDLERIPLFVPGVSAELTVAREFLEPYLIRVTGDPARLDEIDTGIGLPRLDPAPDGALEARLSSLPSFVRLSRGGAFAFGRIADLLALGAILLGAVWAWRRLRSSRSPPGS